jgi:thiopurine S-methyltransferase
MDPSFWHERWRTGQIGFHQAVTHHFLETWWPTVGLAAGSRVYVPLCGKSLDMAWLAARGHRVVGSELSPIAVADFFASLSLVPTTSQCGAFRVHRAGPFEILEGNALDLEPGLLGPVDAVYDRAALVALPPVMREHYARSFTRLLPAGTSALLIAFEYPQALKEGPPFAVMPDEVDLLYGGEFSVREVERMDVTAGSPKFVEAGVPAVFEVAYHLQRRSTT